MSASTGFEATLDKAEDRCKKIFKTLDKERDPIRRARLCGQMAEQWRQIAKLWAAERRAAKGRGDAIGARAADRAQTHALDRADIWDDQADECRAEARGAR